MQSDKRRAAIQVWVSAFADRELIRAEAEIDGRSVSEFMRHAALLRAAALRRQREKLLEGR